MEKTHEKYDLVNKCLFALSKTNRFLTYRFGNVKRYTLLQDNCAQ